MHGATSLLFLLRLLLKITLVYTYKNHMMRNRRRIMVKFFKKIKFFLAKIFFNQNFFTKNFFYQKFFFTKKFFTKNFFTKNFFNQKFFYQKFFHENFFLFNQNFLPIFFQLTLDKIFIFICQFVKNNFH
jgi:hypothetical protein